jgi:hypothetical protein
MADAGDASFPLLHVVNDDSDGGVVAGAGGGSAGPSGPAGRGKGAAGAGGRGRGRGKGMTALLSKTTGMVKGAKQFGGKVGADGVVLATPLFSKEVIVQKKRPGRTSTSSFEDPTEVKAVESDGYDSEEERQRLERERLERERLERERLAALEAARRKKPPTPPSSSSEESVQPSVEGLLQASMTGDVATISSLLEAGTDWDCTSKSVRTRRSAVFYWWFKLVLSVEPHGWYFCELK